MRVLKTTTARVLDVAFCPDNRAVAAAVEGPAVFLWNLDSPAPAPVRLGAEGGFLQGSLRFIAEGRQLRWQSHDGYRHYDRDTRTTTSEVFTHLRPAFWWGASEDGTRALSAHSMPNYYLTGWRLTEDAWVQAWQLSTRELSVSNVTLAPPGDRFAMLVRNTTDPRWWERPMRLEVRDAATGNPLASGTYPYLYGSRLAFHPRGGQLAGIHEMTLLAWELPAGGSPRLVRNPESRKHFTALAYHPTGRHLFATSNDKTVHVFDPHTLERVDRYTWQLDRLSAIAVSKDGTLAAAGSATGDVVVWDLE